MTTEDDYLRTVERMLRGIAPEHRATVLDDLRAQFADAEDAGRSVDETIRALGTPKEIADRAHEEFGGDSRAERAWWMLQGSAVALSAVIGVATAFLVPLYAGSVETSSSDGTSTHTDTVQTLAEANGLWVALIALVPALVAAVPLVVPRRARAAATVACGVLLSAMALIGGFTIGGFFMPTVLLTWTSLIVWTRLRGPGFGLGWRIAGAALTAFPVIGILAGVLTSGGIGISAWAWPVLATVLALAVLIAIGFRSAGWLLAVIGLVLLVAGLVSGQLFTMLVIWLGGWWLTIGLAHAVTAVKRP